MLHSMNLTKPCWGHKGDGKILTDLEVIQMVDETLEPMWKNEIKAYYESGWAEEDSSWIKGRVTELNVSYKRNADNELQFYVVRH